MLQINNYTNFISDNIREAIKRGELPDDNFLLIYLYTEDDYASYAMLKNYGVEIQRLLGVLNLYTFYPIEFIKKWGNAYASTKRVKKEFVETKMNPYVAMKKIRKSYTIDGKDSNPYLILVNPKSGKYKAFKLNSNPYNTIDKDSKCLYNIMARIIKKIHDSINKEFDFSDTARYVNRIVQSSNNIYEYITADDDYENSFINIIKKYLGDKMQRQYNGSLLKYDDIPFLFGISNENFAARFTERPIQPFTEDEAILIAFILGMDVNDTEELIGSLGYKFRRSRRDEKIKEIIEKYKDESIDDIGLSVREFIDNELSTCGFYRMDIRRRLN